jgi:hypothetical protein
LEQRAEGSGSFLKKRTKKLLSLGAGGEAAVVSQTRATVIAEGVLRARTIIKIDCFVINNHLDEETDGGLCLRHRGTSSDRLAGHHPPSNRSRPMTRLMNILASAALAASLAPVAANAATTAAQNPTQFIQNAAAAEPLPAV